MVSMAKGNIDTKERLYLKKRKKKMVRQKRGNISIYKRRPGKRD